MVNDKLYTLLLITVLSVRGRVLFRSHLKCCTYYSKACSVRGARTNRGNTICVVGQKGAIIKVAILCFLRKALGTRAVSSIVLLISL